MGNMVGQFTFMLIYAGRCYAGDGVGDIWSVASLHLRVPPNGAGRMATVKPISWFSNKIERTRQTFFMILAAGEKFGGMNMHMWSIVYIYIYIYTCVVLL